MLLADSTDGAGRLWLEPTGGHADWIYLSPCDSSIRLGHIKAGPEGTVEWSSDQCKCYARKARRLMLELAAFRLTRAECALIGEMMRRDYPSWDLGSIWSPPDRRKLALPKRRRRTLSDSDFIDPEIPEFDGAFPVPCFASECYALDPEAVPAFEMACLEADLWADRRYPACAF